VSEIHPSTCRLCTAHCPVLVTVKGGRVIQVTGDPEAPLYRGYSCPKGRALPEQHNHADRLLHSQKRRADGSHEPIGSEQALDEIAAKLQGLVSRHGPRSVAMYIGTNTLPYPASGGMANALLRAIGSRMFFTANTIDQPGKQIAQALHGGWIAGQPAFDSAHAWLLVGTNPVISKAGGFNENPAQAFKDAVKRGLKLIVIDPRRTESVRRAHIHLQARPGEDPTLLAGLLHVIIAEGLYDKEFVEENVQGFESLADQVKPFTPDYVARRADVRVEPLVEAARVLARAKRGGVTTGTGSSFPTRGNLTSYLALCLNSVCGYWVRAGEKLRSPNVLLQPYTGKAQPYPPYKAWGYGEKLRVRGLTNTTPGLPTAALADEILLEGKGQVKALFCVGSNPMMAWPDQRRSFEALKKLELLVTLDIEMSATARLAHYVIAPRLTFETPGMTQTAEGIKYFGPGLGFDDPYAQYTPKLLDPPEGSDVIEDWELFYGLAQRMGLELQWVNFYGWGRHIESPPQVIPLDMQNKPTTDDIYEIMCRNSRIPLSEVKQYPHGHVFDEVNEVVQPRDEDCEYRLDVGNAYMMQELTQVRAEDFEARQRNPGYPFLLVSRRSYQFLNSSFRTNPRVARRKPYNPAFMNPKDLARLGLKSGDTVTIRSPHDSIRGVVEAERDLRPGVISMSHAFGANPDEDDDPRQVGANTGRLTRVDNEYDPITGIPRMAAIPVAVEASIPSS